MVRTPAPERERAALGTVIGTKAQDIEQRWLARVRADIAKREDVQVTQLRDGMPDYLTELARLMAAAPGADGGASWAEVARGHGITRVQIGFDIDQLVREFIALRNVIEEIAVEAGELTAQTSSRLADAIDAGIVEAVRAYVDARDYEARQRQAERIGFLIHELRNPLQAAVTAEAIAREHAAPAQTRALDAITRAHTRLTELIDSVLLTEKLESGKLEPRMVATNVGELVDRATATARQLAATKRVTFRVACDRTSTQVLDPDLTASAMQNLVDNAVKYTDYGVVDVSVQDDGTSWSVHVHDTGPGLSDAELRVIFEPFERGSTHKHGTGLGLAIARRAIEAQGGSLHVESPDPIGSHFWFTLPLRRA